jgi:hypothetical protein
MKDMCATGYMFHPSIFRRPLRPSCQQGRPCWVDPPRVREALCRALWMRLIRPSFSRALSWSAACRCQRLGRGFHRCRGQVALTRVCVCSIVSSWEGSRSLEEDPGVVGGYMTGRWAGLWRGPRSVKVVSRGDASAAPSRG